MRKEVRQEVVQVRDVEVYIADDGTEFKNKTDCENYEWENVTKPMLEKLVKCEGTEGLPNCNAGYVSDCFNYSWYFIRNQEDVDILNNIYHLGLKDEVIGDWICLETEERWRDAWYTTATDGIDYVTDLFTKLGYKVKITREAERWKS